MGAKEYMFDVADTAKDTFTKEEFLTAILFFVGVYMKKWPLTEKEKYHDLDFFYNELKTGIDNGILDNYEKGNA